MVVRLIGLSLLILAIAVPSCQAVFTSATDDGPRFRPEFVRD